MNLLSGISMATNLREELHHKIETFSEAQLTLLIKIADIVAKQNYPDIQDWSNNEWQNLALRSLWEEDEIEYVLGDAQEIFQP